MRISVSQYLFLLVTVLIVNTGGLPVKDNKQHQPSEHDPEEEYAVSDSNGTLNNEKNKSDDSTSSENLEENKTAQGKIDDENSSEENDDDDNYIDLGENIPSFERFLHSSNEDDHEYYYYSGSIEDDIVNDDEDRKKHTRQFKLRGKGGNRRKARGFFGDIYNSVASAAKSVMSVFTGSSNDSPSTESPVDTDSASNDTTHQEPLKDVITASQLQRDTRPIWERLKDGPVSGLTVDGQTFTFTRAEDYTPPQQASYMGGSYGSYPPVGGQPTSNISYPQIYGSTPLNNSTPLGSDGVVETVTSPAPETENMAETSPEMPAETSTDPSAPETSIDPSAPEASTAAPETSTDPSAPTE